MAAARSAPNFFFSKPKSAYEAGLICPPFRPVAPLVNCLASSTTTLPTGSAFRWASSSSVRATAAPVMPLPMIAMSASSGSFCDLASTSSGNGGSSSQYEWVGEGTGRPGSCEARASTAWKSALSTMSALTTAEIVFKASRRVESIVPMMTVDVVQGM